MPEEFDNDAYRVTWLIRRLFRAMEHEAGEHRKNLSISTADRAVLELIHPDGELSVPEIARRYGVSRQHVQVTVNGLMDKGLVSTVNNPVHKRSPLIAPTARGRAVFDAVLERDRDTVDQLFEGIPQEDRRRTRETLEKLLDKLS